MSSLWRDPRLPSKFWAQVRRSTNGCWLWTGPVFEETGYGRYHHRRTVLTHRLAYDQLVRELIPRGKPGHLQVDHDCHNRSKSCRGGPTCRHRRCVNPNHLVARKPVENTQASRHTPASKNRAKTHCIRGHALAGDNLLVDRLGRRNCRECKTGVGRETRRRRLASERGENWAKTEWNAAKTTCQRGHALSGDNLYVNPANGQRACRACGSIHQADYRRRRASGETSRGVGRALTHCKAGHELSGENLYAYGPEGRYRGCRTCSRDGKRRRRAAGARN